RAARRPRGHAGRRAGGAGGRGAAAGLDGGRPAGGGPGLGGRAAGLSVVIPLVNEQPSLAQLHAQIAAPAAPPALSAEVIFVDDGSTDGSWATVVGLSREDARVRGIRFRRNFGKAAALSAGFKAARGEVVLTLDADLQDDPAEVPRFLGAVRGGLDVVSGW